MLFPHESWDYWIPKREFLTFSMIKWNTMKISFRNDLEYEIFPSWMLLLLLRFDTPHLNQIKEARFRFILSKNFSFSDQPNVDVSPSLTNEITRREIRVLSQKDFIKKVLRSSSQFLRLLLSCPLIMCLLRPTIRRFSF